MSGPAVGSRNTSPLADVPSVVRRRLLIGTGLAVMAAIAVVVVWFEPQALFLDDEVDEAVPVPAGPSTTLGRAGSPSSTAPVAPVEVASGDLRGVEGHDVRGGRAVLLELADGSRFLRLEDLDVENGPDLKVYLSAAPADADPDAHDDDYLGLGGLAGNIGSSNYELPTDVDLERYPSAVIWCERFSVGFAVASLDRDPAASRS